MDYKCVLMVALLELLHTFLTDGCIVPRKDLCKCDYKHHRVYCTRLGEPVDSILPRIVPKTTRELIMRRVWVDDAVELNPRNFAALKYLKLIDFSYNRISEIHVETFRNMQSLESVSLSHNKLRLLDADSFSGSFPKFKKLDLSFNKIVVLTDNNLQAMVNLEYLDLRGNPILFIPAGGFNGVSQLKSLMLSSANFTKFPSEPIKETRSLKLLEMRNMPHLSSIPSGAFGNNTHLVTIYLEDIRLSAGKPSDTAFHGLDNVTNLTMKSCNLISVPRRALSGLEKLQMLDLSGNPLERIHPGDFTTLKSLQTLILRTTGLKEIKVQAFSTLQHIRTLDISHNRLETLYRESFPANISLIETVVMSHNSWSCDCSIKWIASSTIDIGQDPILCIRPEKVQSQSLPELRYNLPNTFVNCQPLDDLDQSATLHTSNEGDEITLPCSYSGTGNETATYTWYHNNRILAVQNLNRYGLFIRKLKLEDSGEYTCEIRNAGGSKKLKMQLKVEKVNEMLNFQVDTEYNGISDCSTQGLKTPVSSTSTGKRETGNVINGSGSSATTSAVLVGILAFVTALGVCGVFVFIGCIWNKRRDRDKSSTDKAVVTEFTKSGNGVCHRIPNKKAKKDSREPYRNEGRVVLGGQGIYSKPLEEL